MGLDAAAIEDLRTMILTQGTGQLAVGDLGADDLAGLAWSGNPAHLRSVVAALQRAAQGLEDYLVVRAPGGQPVAKMRVDYTGEDDTGVFSQLFQCKLRILAMMGHMNLASAASPATL